jgi:drug/metabolite transporter (DMT)-like permease
MNKPKVSPFIAIGLAILSVSTASIFIRLGQGDGIPSLTIAAYRMALAALFIAPLAVWKSHSEIKKIAGTDWILIFLSGFLLACHFASWITSLEYTSVASSVVLVTTAPLWVALLSPLFLKEKITRGILMGLIIALLGSAIVGLSEACSFSPSLSRTVSQGLFTGRTFIGNIFALGGAFFSAGYLMVGRKVRERHSLLAYVFLVYSIAALFLLFFVGITRTPLGISKPIDLVWLVGLALVPQVIGHSTFNWALKFLSAAYVSISLLGEPVGTVILAFIILREKPTAFELVGGGLILCGIYLASRVEKRVDELVANEEIDRTSRSSPSSG